MNDAMKQHELKNPGRRDFLSTAGLAASFAILKPQLVRGTAANSAVRIGLLGCGKRGTENATGMVQNAGARVTALADLFPDRLDAAQAHFSKLPGAAPVEAAQIFRGPDAYKRIAESNAVDAVIIATPVYFHPMHLEAVAASGKHVYLEKPVAVDVAGCRRVLEIGKKTEGRFSFDVGFQLRMSPGYAELNKRIRNGALGEIVGGEAHYFCPYLPLEPYANASAAERRLRLWARDRLLCGDIILEQGIHAMDLCNWMLDAHPLKASGIGTHRGRPAEDTASAHFSILYTYPNDVHVSFNHTQFGKGIFEVNERFFGTRGSSDSPYGGAVSITGEEPWTWGGGMDNIVPAEIAKQKSFIESISSGRFHDQCAQGVESTLTGILGRTAAYTGREIVWDEMIRSNEHWDAGIDLDKLG